MAPPPTGTVTFLFTDIEGSTALWERDRAAMATAVARHIALLTEVSALHGGVHFKTVGDALQIAFATAPEAVTAALDGQRAPQAADWGTVGELRVRMALHAGEAEPDLRGDYLAPALNRLARLLASGYGGQVLLSQAVQQLTRDALPAGATLRDLGEHRLRDLREPERVYQLVHPDLPDRFPPLKSLAARPNNLPRQPTSFLGREEEVLLLVDLIRREDVQLLTLTGPGGVGKTRLALQVAAELLDAYADGVYFVSLATLTEATQVPAAIAAALGVRDEGERPLPERLADFLASKHVLLVLDNVEHVVAAAPDVASLLSTASGLKVLATSRMPLRVQAEREHPVPPLALPQRKPLPSLAQLTRSAAVRLFVERAQAVKPDFALTSANAPAVAEICYRLDGLPLAIELAAARVRLLPPRAMLEHLEKRLPMLTGGARDAPARQRTLRDTIAWSYDLLVPAERILFRRLAVFAGGCTLAAAEAVANRDATLDVFTGLAALSEHSLLRQAEGPGGDPRFTMLETVREYGLEQLAVSEEEEAIRAAHAAHFAALGHGFEREYRGRPGPYLAILEADADNLRAALGWAVEHEDTDLGLRLALAFGMFAERGTPREGQEWYRRVLALPGGVPALRARALIDFGWLALYQGATEAAMEAGTQAATLATAEQPALRARAMNLLGAAELDRGPSVAAQQWLDEALDLAQGVARGEVLVPQIRSNLGLLAGLRDDVAESRRQYEAALAALPPVGMSTLRSEILSNLSSLAWQDGDQQRAAALDREVLLLEGETRNVLSLTISFENAVGVGLALGQPETAARLLGAAAALRQEANLVVEPFNIAEHEALLALTRETLGETVFAAAWQHGERLTLEQAITEADSVLARAAQELASPAQGS